MNLKKPFLHAAGAAVYIVLIVTVMQYVSTVFKNQEGTFATPMVVLSLFVLSAAVMGYLFLSESLFLLFDGNKKAAIVQFGKVVGFFACFAIFFGIIAILSLTVM